MRRGLSLIAGALCGAVAFCTATASAQVPSPTVYGPITGGIHGRPWFGAPFDVGAYGYSENEYFYSGVARAYGATGPSGATAPYETRMLVYRPTDPRRFSGNVIVEWDNVTAQLDSPNDFFWTYPQVLANGDAYVEITAQQAGVCGLGLTGAPLTGASPTPGLCTPFSLKGFDQFRYAPLVDPGDAYADDIFSQGAEAVVHPVGISPLGSLAGRVRRVLAVGQSQSAAELDDYIADGAQNGARLFDGFVIDADAHHALLSSYPVPTIDVWGEESAQPVPSTSPPNDRIWEVAGMGHSDYWSLQQLVAEAEYDLAGAPLASGAKEQAAEWADGAYGQEGLSDAATCAGDDQFPRRYVLDAALSDLETWVATGRPAPSAPQLQFDGLETVLNAAPAAGPVPFLPTESVKLQSLGLSVFTLVRDATGNALGGLRLPFITVPVASYDGDLCVLLGTTTPFPPVKLHRLYPSHADYVAKLLTATIAAVHGRFMTALDGIDLMRRACASAIPAWGTTPVSAQPAVCGRLQQQVVGRRRRARRHRRRW